MRRRLLRRRREYCELAVCSDYQPDWRWGYVELLQGRKYEPAKRLRTEAKNEANDHIR